MFMNHINSFLSNTDFFQNQAHDLSVAESSEKGDNNQGFPNKPIWTWESLISDKFSNFFFGKNVGLLFNIYIKCFDDRLQSWILLKRFTIFPLANRIEHTISGPQCWCRKTFILPQKSEIGWKLFFRWYSCIKLQWTGKEISKLTPSFLIKRSRFHFDGF